MVLALHGLRGRRDLLHGLCASRVLLHSGRDLLHGLRASRDLRGLRGSRDLSHGLRGGREHRFLIVNEGSYYEFSKSGIEEVSYYNRGSVLYTEYFARKFCYCNDY